MPAKTKLINFPPTGVLSRPIYVDAPHEQELLLERFNEQFDTCMYLLRGVEREDISNTHWLQQRHHDKK